MTEIVAGRTETALHRAALPPEARAAMYEEGAAVRPESITETVLAVLALPPEATVSRFDILSARQATPIGSKETAR